MFSNAIVILDLGPFIIVIWFIQITVKICETGKLHFLIPWLIFFNFLIEKMKRKQAWELIYGVYHSLFRQATWIRHTRLRYKSLCTTGTFRLLVQMYVLGNCSANATCTCAVANLQIWKSWLVYIVWSNPGCLGRVGKWAALPNEGLKKKKKKKMSVVAQNVPTR